MEADNRSGADASHDHSWPAREPRLDRALRDAIRAPTVDARFDDEVWALIRTDEAAQLATRRIWRARLGLPWWLGALNVVAIAVTALAVVLALRSMAAKPLAASVAAALSFGGYSTGRIVFALLAGAAGFWFASRKTRSLL